ncbi:MAG: sucrose phosphorylase [Lachnospiraceae bacterium]|nr:sucrose phosphorylase [Lachnospiraceae bacterium]
MGDLILRDRADNGPMLNAYPDSMGGQLSDIVRFLNQDECRDAFGAMYILPSLYHSDLDRGFCVVDYGLNEQYAGPEDLETLQRMGIQLKLDFILNHASANSPQFLDLMEKGNDSEYKDFFIDWNRFWEGCGDMTPKGYIAPDPALIKNMFFRKSGLPFLMVPFPNGEAIPYWNTFYQEILPDGKILGQMDLNIKSPLVWEFYEETLATIASYGAKIVRLDAFAYADKEPGARNFLNEPGTWELLERVRKLAEPYGISLLPEIHAAYAEKTHEVLAGKGYMTYDFFLPGLLIDALESGCGRTLVAWAKELKEKNIRTVNMLGCHDGIPLLDLQGLLPEERIRELIALLVARGGCVKNLHGKQTMYYQVNAAYYSALGEDDDKMLLARALQLFVPGIPQVWYLDLLAGGNDSEAVQAGGAGSHKDINRTNLSNEAVQEKMKLPVVQEQLKLLRFRNNFPAFGFDARFMAACEGQDGEIVKLCWENRGCRAELTADLKRRKFQIQTFEPRKICGQVYSEILLQFAEKI